ncbi:4Fe-4S ferredoxin [bacterium]|nr:4Fe-4S ferredoxin [bacterium]
MTRDIIEINEALCDGCGDCVVGCSEGAIQIIDGKARLVREEFCDGFGDCIGVCHTGALKVIKREAPEFDDAATRRHLLETQGMEAVRRYEMAQARHEGIHAAQEQGGHGGGCPGSAQRELHREVHIPVMQHSAENAGQVASTGHPGAVSAGCPGSAARELRRTAGPTTNPTASPTLIPSELGQWPVQLHLVQPGASFFRNKEMLVMSTCGPIASAEVHQRYLRNRSVVVACPKLDNTALYADKLAAIFQESSIPRVIVVIMEVPCCRGLSMIVEQALAMSGRQDLVVEEHTLTLDGDIKSVRELAAY